MSGERRSFADNRGGDTVAAAIRAFAEYTNDQHPLAIVTGYFDLGGFGAIEDVLVTAPGVRLLLGTEPKPRFRRLPLPGEREAALETALAEGEGRLRLDRDLLPFTAENHTLLRRFRAFLARPEVEVRRYTHGFLHGKAFVFGDEAGVLAGSANFTRKGLTENLELELGQYNPDDVRRVRLWFDTLWAEAETFDLGGLYEGRDLPFDPYAIYLRILLEIYGDPFEDDEPRLPGIQTIELTEFQRLGVRRALRILDRWNGILLADGVGLGKTFMAGDIIRHFVHNLGQRALLVVPASLRDQTWERFLAKFGLSADVVSYQQLALDTQVGEAPDPEAPDLRRPHLRFKAGDYRLVVVDEAHALRNPETQYYRSLRRLMSAGGTMKKLVLLTATPVNNSFWDLYHQILLFARHDAAFAEIGVPALRDHFKSAMTMDFQEQAPRHLFPLLDAVSVRRTRRHIQRFFPGATLMTPDGPKEIRFPSPRLVPVAYSLEALLPGFFDEVAAAVRDDLTLARYRTADYRREPGGDSASQNVLAGLLRSQLLKRFESSIYAFRRTLDKLIDSHDTFLKLLDAGMVAGPATDYDELAQSLEDDDLMSELAEQEGLESAGAFDVEGLRRDAQADRERLWRLRTDAEAVAPEDDPKLGALWGILAECADQTEGDGRKVLVFSYFADTVKYISTELQKATHPGLSVYRERFAAVTGSGDLDRDDHAVSPQSAVFGFAPTSSNAPPGTTDRYDLLIATDVLAEGQNLQQAGRLVNFDLPWNPMRLAQRNGRIDRLNSPHAVVHLYCFFPATELDRVLNLEEVLRSKIAAANASVGLDSPILPGTRAVERTFADARRQIEAIAAGREGVLDELEEEAEFVSGESFRDELRQGLMEERLRQLKDLPWGAGSGVRRPGSPGVVFAARVGSSRQVRFAPLDPALALDKELLLCLEKARCRPDDPRHLPDEVRDRLFDLWQLAREAIFRDYQVLRDPAVMAARLPKVQRDALAVLRRADVAGAEETVRGLQVPWSSLVGRKLRGILRLAEEGRSEVEIAARLVRFAQEEGLLVPAAQDLPPPVDLEDIVLVCYQAVSP